MLVTLGGQPLFGWTSIRVFIPGDKDGGDGDNGDGDGGGDEVGDNGDENGS